MTDPTATDQLMQRHAELQASAARAATADASASTTSVTSGAAVDLHVRPPPRQSSLPERDFTCPSPSS